VPIATLHDGSALDVQIRGTGPALLIPVNPVPVEGPRADEMRKCGADPALGAALIDRLADRFRVIAFDYEGHVLRCPMPDTLTPDHLAADFTAIAATAEADTFAYYGYSWLALAGLQLAIRSDRLTALVMGGFPAIGGPYAEMLAVTTAAHQMSLTPVEPAGDVTPGDWDSVTMTMPEEQTRQFVTLYESLRGFDDRGVDLDIPRLCFAGSADTIAYGDKWGDVTVDIAGPLTREAATLVAKGWEVRVLDGLDHTGAMQAAAVLPTIKPWLIRNVPA
jgi:pimeloyl-ACP methyl ester carboxylesterase